MRSPSNRALGFEPLEGAQFVDRGIDNSGVPVFFRFGGFTIKHIGVVPFAVGKQQRRDVVAAFGLQGNGTGTFAAEVRGVGVDAKYLEVSLGFRHFFFSFPVFYFLTN